VFNRSAIQPNSTVSPCSPPSPRPLSPALPIRLSDGEVHFLWSFIQGSIMIPETRRALRRAWGMCQRHSYGFLAVDAAFRHGWLHAPTILYADLMERARAALDIGGLFWPARLAARLRARGPCLMCGLVSVAPDTPVADGAATLANQGRHPILVLEDGRLLGVIGRADVVRALLEAG